MYKTHKETLAFFEEFTSLVPKPHSCDIIIAPPFTSLALLAALEKTRGIEFAVAAQNGHWEREGAFTGETSMRMIADCGGEAVIIGHSERRQFFGETDESVNRKVKAALEAKLTPIVCVGETLAQRESHLTHSILKRQFEGGLDALTEHEFSRILLAYEPVWAIGTGKTATPEMAADAHRYLRELAATVFSPSQAAGIRILYGGSVKPDNIKGLMAQAEIDGALVGGASLDAKSFAAIVNF
jgi:triosephosphate isomerase